MKFKNLFLFPLLMLQHLWGDQALISIYAVDLESGKVLVSKNCDQSMTPASCMKIVTTAAALQLLGTSTRFETHLEYDGYIDDANTLHGNIYIRGGGDPGLGIEPEKQINTWASSIETLGIHKITGKIIADATLWERALAPSSWSWEDLGNYYGAGACALSFHENFYSLILKPGKNLGEKAYILRTYPEIPSIDFQNEVTTGPKGSGDCACIYGSEYSYLRFVRGTIPLGGDEFVIKGAIPDPPALCADLLTKELQNRSIEIEQGSMNSKRIVFHTTPSKTVGEIVHKTNQISSNLYAEHLLKSLGNGSTNLGTKAVTEYWDSQGIDLSGFNMVDGSGLSRKNLITTRQLVEMLLKIRKSDFFPVFLESLPKREGTIRAKSGTMSLIKAFAGYTDKIAFAIIVNQCMDQQKLNNLIPMLLESLPD